MELKRTLGGFQVFAVSFAFSSVAVGVFATDGEMLQTAGPVGIWLWIAAAVGQILVALVVAQFAARIAPSGSSFQWASRLANPRVGWLFGWLSFWYLAITAVILANALVSQALMPLLGIPVSEGTARVLTSARSTSSGFSASARAHCATTRAGVSSRASRRPRRRTEVGCLTRSIGLLYAAC
ncbi:amino acid permease [Microbacterium dextranolyticum]|uniref:Amino acid permease n=1 Tax=Microbacterium dextranolyticum TaxID=36806 RepID=A0A9W6HMY9_9MICO|nr:amino acid permease [Microbacterium dextranolyticum]MBM7462886.1 amino acid transporter [Microbacterium dextranolyticum]GLJ96008.1 hypothetical protein GCM10017591_20710 [Microbacterium dextranolyticum]